jgi:hypothetical protein
VLTGVIYGAIVVVWAAYLVPLALRRHDEASRGRSIARFSSAMRVLARRGASGTAAASANARMVITPKPKGPDVIAPEPVAGPAQVLVRPRPNREAERAAAARRRQVLSVLIGLTTVIVLTSLVGLTPWWSALVPVALIVAFLVVARRSVRQANEAYWVAAAAAPEPSSVVVRRAAARVDASRPVDDDEPTVTLTAAERKQAAGVEAAEEHAVAVALETPEGGSLWDPLPVTLPTYVGAPVAKRTFRTIEIGDADTWSSGHSKEDSAAVAAAAAPRAGDVKPTDAERLDDEPDEVAQAVNS